MQKEKEVLKEVVQSQLEKPEESGQAQIRLKDGVVQEKSKEELGKEEERRIEATDPNWI